MKHAVLANAIKTCADPKRAKHYLDLLRATQAGPLLDGFHPEQARVLAAVLGGSQTLSGLLVAHPDWLQTIEPERLKFPRRKQGLENEVASWLEPALETLEYARAFGRIREFKQCEMLRIGARDLARLGTLPEIILEISDLADICLEAVWRICQRQLVSRYGQPYHQDPSGRWRPTAGCVLGMGKLGGQPGRRPRPLSWNSLWVTSAEGRLRPGLADCRTGFMEISRWGGLRCPPIPTGGGQGRPPYRR